MGGEVERWRAIISREVLCNWHRCQPAATWLASCRETTKSECFSSRFLLAFDRFCWLDSSGMPYTESNNLLKVLITNLGLLPCLLHHFSRQILPLTKGRPRPCPFSNFELGFPTKLDIFARLSIDDNGKPRGFVPDIRTN